MPLSTTRLLAPSDSMIRLELRVYFSGSNGARIFLNSCLDPDAAPDAPKIQHTNTQNSLLARKVFDR